MTFECRNITLNNKKNDHLTMLLIIVVVLFYSYHQNEVQEKCCQKNIVNPFSLQNETVTTVH